MSSSLSSSKKKNYHLDRVNLGCDPEFFFKRENVIVESAEILPKGGISFNRFSASLQNNPSVSKPTIVRDGVQGELNPQPANCVESLGYSILDCFKAINLLTEEKVVDVDFSQNVVIDDEAFERMGKGAKHFGCKPTENIYGSGESNINVDPAEFKGRSAGGHIHLGYYNADSKKALKRADKLVPVLDLLVGNTSVLLDRDPSNVERRKVYGKAGEFRTPEYGLEYRTLSNFWLRSYPLMVLVMEMSRLAVNIVVWGKDKELMDGVEIERVRQAINENDFDLAYQNFNEMKERMFVIIEGAKSNRELSNFPISRENCNAFEYLVDKGIKNVFPKAPLRHWTDLRAKLMMDNTGVGLRSLTPYGWHALVRKIQSKLAKELLSK